MRAYVVLAFAASGLWVSAFSLLPAASSQGAAGFEQSAPDCVKVRGEPRFLGYGQTHVVVVKNTCDRRVGCEVFTDVDPTPRHSIVLSPGSTQEVVTRQGSPSSAFQPGYRCDYK